MQCHGSFLFQCSTIHVFLNICQQVIYNFNCLTTEDKFGLVMSSSHDDLMFHLAKLLYVAFKCTVIIDMDIVFGVYVCDKWAFWPLQSLQFYYYTRSVKYS